MFSDGHRRLILQAVYTVFTLDIIQTLFGAHQAWFYSVRMWSDPTALFSPPPWTALMVPIMCGLSECYSSRLPLGSLREVWGHLAVAAIVQIFYAWYTVSFSWFTDKSQIPPLQENLHPEKHLAHARHGNSHHNRPSLKC